MKKLSICVIIILTVLLVYFAINLINKNNNSGSNSSTENVTQNQNSTNSGTEITLDQAKSIAEKDAGATSPKYKKEETDFEDGRKIYEIEFIYDNKEYDYDIDAKSGKILQKEIDNNGLNLSNNNSTQQSITSEEAENIALKDAGVSRTDVRYINSHIDKDDGINVYEIEFAVGNTEYDYDINAENGVIVSKDID